MTEKEIWNLKEQIEQERRKSSLDMAKISKLENLVREKTEGINRATDKQKQDAEQVQQLRAEIENERRKSMAD